MPPGRDPQANKMASASRWWSATVGTTLSQSDWHMTSSLRNCLLIALLLVLSREATAQEDPIEQYAIKALRGLKAVTLIVDGIDEDSKRCGLTPELIRDAFLFPVSQTKLEVSDSSDVNPIFHISINSLIQRVPNQCIASLAFTLFNYQRVKLDYVDNPDERHLEVRLWYAQSVLVSGAAPGDPSHPQIVRQTIENTTKKFLTFWFLANKS
jgi:hypothetical protein